MPSYGTVDEGDDRDNKIFYFGISHGQPNAYLSTAVGDLT